jgi:ABC-type hemin transport system substrate-binding protein
MRPARRIVSLVPSLTEALFDLGGEERVVGVTDYCISPPAAGERERVGGPRDADIERILSLHPDRILVGREETSRSSVDALCARGAPVELIDCRSYQDALELLGALGELCGGTPG